MDRVTFRNRMQLLRAAQCHVLPLPEALARLEAGSLPPRSVVLTFDDGSYDVYAVAAPILREFEFPATIYLTTYYCQRQLPVFNPICAYLLWKGQGRDLSLNGILPEGGEVHLAGEKEWRAVFRRIWDYTQGANLSALGKDELAERLAGQLGFDYSALRRQRLLHLMNPEEAAQLSKQGFAFQLHTHRHMLPRDPVLFEREIRDNSEVIRDITGSGSSPLHFCYPSGDYLPQFFAWLRKLGIESATTCDPGLMERGIDSMCIPRFLDMPTIQAAEVESWIAGFTPWLRARLGRPMRAVNPYQFQFPTPE
jgi:peptidoglycan/xylan/chitin deacetylase (PgdA/CDA1 family)